MSFHFKEIGRNSLKIDEVTISLDMSALVDDKSVRLVGRRVGFAVND